MSVSSMNRGASETQVVAPHSYDDFSSPTATRRDQIVVEGKTLYVNLGYLAEYSKFFAECYEQKTSPVFIDDFNYDAVLELMRVCFFCPQRKPINHHNINTVVTMASQYEMGQLMKRCEHVIATQVELFTAHRLFELTKTLSKHQRNSLSMSIMMGRLSRMDNNQFGSLPFKSIPGDVVANLYSLKLQNAEERALSRKMWPRIMSLLTCGMVKKSPDVRLHLSPASAAVDKGKRSRVGVHFVEPVSGERDEAKVKKSVRLVTSTPIVPAKGKKAMPMLLRFDQSPITGGELADSELELEEDGELSEV